MAFRPDLSPNSYPMAVYIPQPQLQPPSSSGLYAMSAGATGAGATVSGGGSAGSGDSTGNTGSIQGNLMPGKVDNNPSNMVNQQQLPPPPHQYFYPAPANYYYPPPPPLGPPVPQLQRTMAPRNLDEILTYSKDNVIGEVHGESGDDQSEHDNSYISRSQSNSSDYGFQTYDGSAYNSYVLNLYNLLSEKTTNTSLRSLITSLLKENDYEDDEDSQDDDKTEKADKEDKEEKELNDTIASLISHLQIYKSSNSDVCWAKITIKGYQNAIKLLNILNGYLLNGNVLQCNFLQNYPSQQESSPPPPPAGFISSPMQQAQFYYPFPGPPPPPPPQPQMGPPPPSNDENSQSMSPHSSLSSPSMISPPSLPSIPPQPQSFYNYPTPQPPQYYNPYFPSYQFYKPLPRSRSFSYSAYPSTPGGGIAPSAGDSKKYQGKQSVMAAGPLNNSSGNARHYGGPSGQRYYNSSNNSNNMNMNTNNNNNNLRMGGGRSSQHSRSQSLQTNLPVQQPGYYQMSTNYNQGFNRYSNMNGPGMYPPAQQIPHFQSHHRSNTIQHGGGGNFQYQKRYELGNNYSSILNPEFDDDEKTKPGSMETKKHNSSTRRYWDNINYQPYNRNLFANPPEYHYSTSYPQSHLHSGAREGSSANNFDEEEDNETSSISTSSSIDDNEKSTAELAVFHTNKYVSENRLFIGNIPFQSTYQSLFNHLNSIKDVQIVQLFLKTQMNGISKGFAIVLTNGLSDSIKLIEKFNGVEFEGRKLIVRFDKLPKLIIKSHDVKKRKNQEFLNKRNEELVLKEKEVARELINVISNLKAS